MATVTVETYKVLTPEESAARRKRISGHIKKIELELIERSEREAAEKSSPDI